MIDELPLELLIHILSPLNVRDLIKLRAVSKKWRLMIDQHLLLQLNFFNHHKICDIFSKHNLTHSNPKNSIRYYKNPRYRSMVNLEKIQFLFRNTRKLNMVTGMLNYDPMDEFISE